MDKYLILFCLVSSIECGPYIWRPRPVAKPLVASAQWFVHRELLSVEKRVLQTSLDISRLATATTREAYRLTEVAWSRLRLLREELRHQYRSVQPLLPGCVRPADMQRVFHYLDKLSEELFNCTHGLSDEAAGFEVSMTDVLITARSRIWNVQQAMWFCQKYQQEVDTACVERLVVEGLEVSADLPGRGRRVLDRAQAKRAQTLTALGHCFARGLSAAEQRQVAVRHTIADCVARRHPA